MYMTNTKKLNIAMIGHKRIPSREGGIEIVVEELSIRMVQCGHHVTCFNRSGHHISGKEFDKSKRLDNYKGIKLKRVFTINCKGLAAVSSSIVAATEAAFGKYDVVHFHAEGPAFMCWLPKLFGKKIIVTIHGLDHQRAKWGRLASWYILRGEKSAVRFADEIIVLSSGIQNYFMEKYGRKTKFIPNGVNRPQKRTAEVIKTRWDLEPSGYILYLGRIVPEKGEKYLIEAFRQVKTNKKLVIAGGSSDTDMFMHELREMAKDDDRVIFTGFVQGQELEELYSNAYVYCLPSDLEGMPLSLLEAMSYGNCCLTSDIVECVEVVGNNAITFRKSDVNDLRDKIQMLCARPDVVQKFKDISEDYICRKYSWDDVVEKTIRLYQ